MSVNPLDEKPQIRKALYLAQWICNGLIGAYSIVILAQSDTPPKWFTIVVAVLGFLWTYTGITAQGNTPAGGVPGNPDPAAVVGHKDEVGAGEVDLLVRVVCIVLLVVLVVWIITALL